MPEGSSVVPVSVRAPAELIEQLDKVAAAMDRSRSWVMLDAVRTYLANEGQEALDVQAGLEEANRGETVPFEQVLADLDEKVRRAGAGRAAG